MGAIVERLRNVCVAKVCAAFNGTSTLRRKTLLHNVPNGFASLAAYSHCQALLMLPEYADQEMCAVPKPCSRYKVGRFFFTPAPAEFYSDRFRNCLPCHSWPRLCHAQFCLKTYGLLGLVNQSRVPCKECSICDVCLCAWVLCGYCVCVFRYAPSHARALSSPIFQGSKLAAGPSWAMSSHSACAGLQARRVHA